MCKGNWKTTIPLVLFFFSCRKQLAGIQTLRCTEKLWNRATLPTKKLCERERERKKKEKRDRYLVPVKFAVKRLKNRGLCRINSHFPFFFPIGSSLSNREIKSRQFLSPSLSLSLFCFCLFSAYPLFSFCFLRILCFQERSWKFVQLFSASFCL